MDAIKTFVEVQLLWERWDRIDEQQKTFSNALEKFEDGDDTVHCRLIIIVLEALSKCQEQIWLAIKKLEWYDDEEDDLVERDIDSNSVFQTEEES